VSEGAQGGGPTATGAAAAMARTRGAVMQRMLEAQAAQAAAVAKQAKMMAEMSAEQDREMALLAQELKALGSTTDAEPAGAAGKKSSTCVLQ
jgi:hypothetical protein